MIELLVVIAIIGLLSTLAVISLGNARAKSRDARRLSDIRQMQSALALYYNEAATYPADDDGTPSWFAAATIDYGGTTWMAQIPTDPGGNAYTYTLDSATSYTITYQLENDTNGITGGVAHNATPAGLVND